MPVTRKPLSVCDPLVGQCDQEINPQLDGNNSITELHGWGSTEKGWEGLLKERRARGGREDRSLKACPPPLRVTLGPLYLYGCQGLAHTLPNPPTPSSSHKPRVLGAVRNSARAPLWWSGD